MRAESVSSFSLLLLLLLLALPSPWPNGQELRLGAKKGESLGENCKISSCQEHDGHVGKKDRGWGVYLVMVHGVGDDERFDESHHHTSTGCRIWYYVVYACLCVERMIEWCSIITCHLVTAVSPEPREHGDAYEQTHKLSQMRI